nr:MAG TPA: hypothetical protein [Caudoviricetes sp.]
MDVVRLKKGCILFRNSMHPFPKKHTSSFQRGIY